MSEQAQGFSQSEQKTYATVSGGKFRLKVTEKSNPALIQNRVKIKGPNAGQEVAEECHDQLTGRIKSIEFDFKNTYGKQLDIIVAAAGEEIKFSLKLEGGPAKSFLKTLPNIDLSQDILFKPKSEIVVRPDKSEIQSNSMLLQQNGIWLKQFFKKDAMNGMPEIVKTTDPRSGKDTYNGELQIEFLIDYTLNNATAFLRAAAAAPVLTATPPQGAVRAPATAMSWSGEIDEELPF